MIAHVAGTDLFYETHGRGTPLLVMHGGLGWDHGYLRSLDPLGSEVQVIYYDHRGNGRSSRTQDWEVVDNATWVEDAEALRAFLGIEKMLLFGHSYGGFLAQEYALRYPERLHGLILCATTPALDYGEVVEANARARSTADQLEAVRELFGAAVPNDQTFGALMHRALPIYYHRFDGAYVDQMFDVAHCFSSDAFNHAFTRCVADFDVSRRLGEISVPTLVLSGDDDWITPLSHAYDRLKAGIPGAEGVVLNHVGHFPMIEASKLTVDAIWAWIRGHVHVEDAP